MVLKRLFTLIFLGVFLILTGCSEDEAPCSNANNVDDPQCTKNIPSIDTREVVLNLAFEDSFYYDTATRLPVVISKDNLEGGLVGQTVPIFSSFLNISKQAALDSVVNARAQSEEPGNFLESDLNIIPYIEVVRDPGVKYLYNYIKKDLNGQPVASVTGTMIERDGRVFLPFVNSMFNGQFFTANESIGSRFIHSISITAQSDDRQGSKIARVEFEATLQTPITDYYIDYASNMESFNLKNRFNYYYNGTDGIANDNFKFFTLRERDEAESVPVDIKILFKARPKIQIEQELFFEMPIDIDTLKTTGEVKVVRGEAFYVQKVTLDSDSDFKMKVRMNGQVQNLTDGREFVVEDLPAGTPWDVEFFANFQQNPAFSDPQGQALITPYKPTCMEITGGTYLPLTEASERVVAKNNQGFLSTCHPQVNQKVFLSKAALATTNLDLTDTFYDYFNYIPQNDLINQTGHFNGIRSIKIKMEGCMRVFVKTPTSSTFELKSVSNTACIEEGEQNAEGWVYFNAEKVYTINNHINEYEGIPGLRPLIQSFGSKPILRTPHFKFNGLVNNTDHLY